jgi:hypothetical protein
LFAAALLAARLSASPGFARRQRSTSCSAPNRSVPRLEARATGGFRRCGQMLPPFSWEVLHRRNDPNNPYGLVESSRSFASRFQRGRSCDG